MIQSSTHRRNSAPVNTAKKASVYATDLVSNFDVNQGSGQHAATAWMGTGAWRLPSGKALFEFALQAGFLAPNLFAADGRCSLIGSLSLGRESGKRAD